ncbi:MULTISPECIES: SUKH-3 domain-containing protein [Pseudoalteromonas]|uniref:SUKH-3 domain-containing protein n=1 Tax=Pseudoalteromonas TaxID=53246 RepID=UPI000F7B0B9B|nr:MULTISPECIES: SUKH-3 domain-containing protein [Pseudoalteromonas]MCG7560342.1 SUKH-3 domain-containing protein [Pseudoalteromonas sp. McH1-42]
MNSEQYVENLFINAGWHKGRKIKVKKQVLNSFKSAYQNAIKVITEFGGLNVGKVGAGRECSASDICFRTETFDFGGEFHNYWVNLNTSLFSIASAHHDHMMLLVDDNNEFYIFTDPDEQLYKVGSFDETVKRVLLGINYGKALEKA